MHCLLVTLRPRLQFLDDDLLRLWIRARICLHFLCFWLFLFLLGKSAEMLCIMHQWISMYFRSGKLFGTQAKTIWNNSTKLTSIRVVLFSWFCLPVPISSVRDSGRPTYSIGCAVGMWFEGSGSNWRKFHNIRMHMQLFLKMNGFLSDWFIWILSLKMN